MPLPPVPPVAFTVPPLMVILPTMAFLELLLSLSLVTPAPIPAPPLPPTAVIFPPSIRILPPITSLVTLNAMFRPIPAASYPPVAVREPLPLW